MTPRENQRKGLTRILYCMHAELKDRERCVGLPFSFTELSFVPSRVHKLPKENVEPKQAVKVFIHTLREKPLSVEAAAASLARCWTL